MNDRVQSSHQSLSSTNNSSLSLKTSLERTRVTSKRQAGRDNGGRKQSWRCWFHWVHWEPMQRWVTAANNESPKRCEHTPVEFLFVIPLKQLVFFLSVFKAKRRSMEVKLTAWVQLCSTEVKLEEYQCFYYSSVSFIDLYNIINILSS